VQAALQACSVFEAHFPERAPEVATTKAGILEEKDTLQKEAQRRHKLAREVRAGRRTARTRRQQFSQIPANSFSGHAPESSSAAASGACQISVTGHCY